MTKKHSKFTALPFAYGAGFVLKPEQQGQVCTEVNKLLSKLEVLANEYLE